MNVIIEETTVSFKSFFNPGSLALSLCACDYISDFATVFKPV